jgi:hypothetical protein
VEFGRVDEADGQRTVTSFIAKSILTVALSARANSVCGYRRISE